MTSKIPIRTPEKTNPAAQPAPTCPNRIYTVIMIRIPESLTNLKPESLTNLKPEISTLYRHVNLFGFYIDKDEANAGAKREAERMGVHAQDIDPTRDFKTYRTHATVDDVPSVVWFTVRPAYRSAYDDVVDNWMQSGRICL